MIVPQPDSNRRKLLATTAGLGALGVGATAVPFLASLTPSEAVKAAGAPVDVDISRIAPATLLTVEWRGRPIWILHRDEAMLASLQGHDQLLADPRSKEPQQPAFAANPGRALRPPFFVAVAVCTHLGCIPTFRPERGAPDISADWPGGFYCPCHGSRFDLAGRVFKNVPAPRNLEIPEYFYPNPERLRIGAEK